MPVDKKTCDTKDKVMMDKDMKNKSDTCYPEMMDKDCKDMTEK